MQFADVACALKTQTAIRFLRKTHSYCRSHPAIFLSIQLGAILHELAGTANEEYPLYAV